MNIRIKVIISLCLVLIVTTDDLDETLKIEKRIKDTILNSNYDKTIRPSVSVSILMDIALKQIVAIDERNQFMTTASYLFVKWYDPRLKWNSTLSNGVASISVLAKNIWLPDLFITNTADNNGFIQVTDLYLAFIENDGYVRLTLSLIGLRTRCLIKIKKFPFDTQNCPIKIGSWAQDKKSINIQVTANYSSVSDFTENPVWNIVEVKELLQKSASRFDLKAESNDFLLKLIIKRKPLYYIINNVFSCLILNIITLLMFFIPFQLQATLTISTFLSLGIISIRVSSDIPVQSSYLPLINLFFMLNLLYTFVSFAWFVASDQFRTKKYLPSFLLRIMDVFFRKKLNKRNKQVNVITKKEENSKNEQIELTAENHANVVAVVSKLNELPKNELYFNEKLNALNLVAFFLMFIFMFVSYLYILLNI